MSVLTGIDDSFKLLGGKLKRKLLENTCIVTSYPLNIASIEKLVNS